MLQRDVVSKKKVWNSDIVTTNFSVRWKTDLAKVQFIVFYTVYFILFELTSTEDSHQLTSFAREHTTFEGMLRSGKEYAKYCYCTASVNRVGTQSLCSS